MPVESIPTHIVLPKQLALKPSRIVPGHEQHPRWNTPLEPLGQDVRRILEQAMSIEGSTTQVNESTLMVYVPIHKRFLIKATLTQTERGLEPSDIIISRFVPTKGSKRKIETSLHITRGGIDYTREKTKIRHIEELLRTDNEGMFAGILGFTQDTLLATKTYTP